MLRHATLCAVVLLASAAAAQQRPIFDPDDFVNPLQRDGTLFISRLVAGGAANAIDDYRPLHHDTRFLLLANSLYVSRFQLDYKHSEARGGISQPVQVCGCTPPIYFPTPPTHDSTPAAPLPGSKETLQFAWYNSAGGSEGEPPVTLRYRLAASRQAIDTVVESFATGQVVLRLSGREQSLGLDADTYFRVGGHDVFGSLLAARTVRTGTTDNRSQNELGYMSRFPGVVFHDILLRATLTVGSVSGRGGVALNVISPAFEAFWHDPRTRANLHLVWNPQSTNSGTGGWETHSQVAFFVDRALYVKLFRSPQDEANHR
jgi:hypothetical protein